jgi:hypothetical protein
LFIENKIKNHIITEDDVLQIHNEYLENLHETYQAQPRSYDELVRFNFVSSMLVSYKLYADPELLWIVLSDIPAEGSAEYSNFESNVLDVIEDVYAELSKNRLKLDIVSILIVVSQFFIRRMFKDCILWVIANFDKEPSNVDCNFLLNIID